MPLPVTVRREAVVLPTYEPHQPDPHPMFLEKRVYQGSSGRVYPLPCTDRIAEQPRPHTWKAVFLENEYLSVMLLPELGGRIHRIIDKTNGYDAIYYQPVIKPALVGLAGPWCSGGIEFNWPQHHRPSTFMAADVAIEKSLGGSATVWMSEHDPMARMKGMHGVRLYPGQSYVELCARAYNRTDDVQTFLWWANVATRVHEGYQSFFPPDVTSVADHAKRATTSFPCSDGSYYGVDYGARGRHGVPESEKPRQFVPPHCLTGKSSSNAGSSLPGYRPDDLSWYANIPVPTSYMCVGSSGDFFGGYDFKAQAGLVHVANHHISPGKKQWTWGNHEFGYAWDRNLTDADANGVFHPYIELMAGVFTDNQPDFSFLQPGETKKWSQYWYPIRDIGSVIEANIDAALSLRIEGRTATVGVAVTAEEPNLLVQLSARGKRLQQWVGDLSPARPGLYRASLPKGLRPAQLSVSISAADGRVLLAYSPRAAVKGAVPAPATEPPQPSDVESGEQLFLIGLHLEQYRHATRMPQDYWREGLRRDSGDSHCHLALGRWHLRRGEFEEAETHLRQSIARLTSRNPNPYDGEAYYQLGRCLRHRHLSECALNSPLRHDLLTEAYAAFYKATWNHGWQSASFHALAEIDCVRGDWMTASEHIERSLRLNADNLGARALQVFILRKMGDPNAAAAALAEAQQLDPLDWWAIYLSGQPMTCDNQVRLDLALDCVRSGLLEEALNLLSGATPAPVEGFNRSSGTEPMLHYARAWITALIGKQSAPDGRLSVATRARVLKHLDRGERAPSHYCFPARLDEIAILEHAIAARPAHGRASYYLGNFYYDRRRHDEAIACWERAVKREPGNAIAWRNLGIAYHNVSHDPRRARAAYDRAFQANPASARVAFERDQLWKRLGESPARRLAALEKVSPLVRERDDLSVEYCALCNQTGRYEEAYAILTTRHFQPWEGGEGQALGQYVRTHLALGRDALRAGNAADAVKWFSGALTPPPNLGEARHLLANASDIQFWLGCAQAANGDTPAARRHWTAAAEFKGDFQTMSVRAYSELSYYSALALRKLGRTSEATGLLRAVLAFARRLGKAKASIDYFATSLPTMLLFDDDLQQRQRTYALLLEGQALLGLGERTAGKARLRAVLKREPSHALAADLLATAISTS